MRPYGCWENVCCILYAHWYLSNPFHLTIEWNLTLIQNELWVPNGCHAHFKVFFLIFRISKRCHHDFNLTHTYCNCYTSFLGVKSSEKWFIRSFTKSLSILQINNMNVMNTLSSWTNSINVMSTHHFLNPYQF